MANLWERERERVGFGRVSKESKESCAQFAARLMIISGFEQLKEQRSCNFNAGRKRKEKETKELLFVCA